MSRDPRSLELNLEPLDIKLDGRMRTGQEHLYLESYFSFADGRIERPIRSGSLSNLIRITFAIILRANQA